MSVIRIFGSTDCDDCRLAMSYLEDLSLDYEYIDAFSEESKIEKLCDDYDVDELPHVQVLNKKGRVISEFIGIDDFISNIGKVFRN